MYSLEDETLNITWPESELGTKVVQECPCGGLAIRVCTGTNSDSVHWDSIMECPELRETTIRLCVTSNSKVK